MQIQYIVTWWMTKWIRCNMVQWTSTLLFSAPDIFMSGQPTVIHQPPPARSQASPAPSNLDPTAASMAINWLDYGMKIPCVIYIYKFIYIYNYSQCSPVCEPAHPNCWFICIPFWRLRQSSVMPMPWWIVSTITKSLQLHSTDRLDGRWIPTCQIAKEGVVWLRGNEKGSWGWKTTGMTDMPHFCSYTSWELQQLLTMLTCLWTCPSKLLIHLHSILKTQAK